MLIELRNVYKRYGKVEALKGISITIDSGVTGLIGPNGSGKTTLIKLILGLIKPTQGLVRVFGVDPWIRGKQVRERIGVLHEKPMFPGWATGRDFLRFVGELRGVRDPHREADEMLRIVGLSEAGDKRIGEYSAGMVQRLGIAQALIGSPEFIILDEPTANLDPKGRIEVLDLIGRISRERGASFLISTHILPELERVCESIIILIEGKILDAGSIGSLAEKYCAYSLAIRSEDPIKIAEWLKTLTYVRDVTLKGEEVTLRTSNLKQLTEDLKKNRFKITYVREKTNLLETIYMEAMKEGSKS